MAESPLFTRADVARSATLVDAVGALGAIFEPVGHDAFRFVPSPERAVLTGPGTVAVAWEYTGRHVTPFVSIEPTMEQVLIKGMTLFHADAEGEVSVRRHIDWSYVFAQLGSMPNRGIRPTPA